MDFMRIMFGVVMLHVHGASASVYMSTTSRGYTSTETGSPSFQCYRSHPYWTAAVSKGRYVYVYNDINDPANDEPPASVAFDAGNPPVQAYRINLETSNHSSYGAFYCAASLDGEHSVVPTLFLRSDAKFVPTSGRFSKTVNKGDVNVTVDFTEVSPSGTVKTWRFIGTTDHGDTISQFTIFEEYTVYTIVGEVDISHGGVYELHLMSERSLARAGLLRLIVRACPAGRYDESNGCNQICPSCYNGGVCHDQTGICICPPGFQGDGCEIACGGHRYGRNCEYRCDYEISDDSTVCSGLQVCVPDPYGCSCTPGYKGLDCTTDCDQGEFGASCTETCHCVSGECDRFTGVCTGSSTECELGWTGSNCHECMVGRYGPNCELFTGVYEKTNKGQFTIFFCSLEDGHLISTAEPVVNLYRKVGSGNYTQENIIPNGRGFPPNEQFLFLVRDVKIGELFVCSLSDVNNFFSDTITGDGEFTQPELPSAPVVSGATNDSITLMWDAWDASTDIGDPPLVGYRVYYMLNNSREEEQEVRRSDRLAPSQTVTGLSPDTAYIFCVAAVRPGLGGSGSRLEVVGTTQCSPPSRGPSSVYVTKGTTPGEILVSWENPPSNTSSCASGEGGIRIYFTRSDIPSGISKRAADPIENSIDIPFGPSTSEHTLTLEPYSQYLIQVVVYNKDSETPRGEGFTQITEEMLAPAPTVSVEATSETVTVRWNAASPAHLNGDVQGYQLRYTRTKPEPLDPVIVNVMCNEYVITEGATKDSEFEIEVRVLNGAGPGEWSPLMTSPLPGDASRYSLRVLLLTGLIPSIVILLICVFCIILIVVFFRRRQPDKGESDKSTHNDSLSPETANTYQDLYERVSNDGTAYQELELTSVQQGDTDYINIEEGPRGRKNILKSIENADC